MFGQQPQWVQDAMVISSGTICTLTGIGEFQKIDDIQRGFVQFCVGIGASEPNAFANWQEAWKAYQETRHART